ncbi:MAG: cytochrome C [Bacteroidota bacterium]
MLLFQTPIPRDIPLPLPMPEWLLVAVLVVAFLAHILFVNLMVGGTLFTFAAQIAGLKQKRYDLLGKEIAATITVTKSLAVVLGVAPLLAINALYTVYFYSANALTGYAWISIIPLVFTAFLILYYHKYSWDAYEGNRVRHIMILSIPLGILLFVPLIFLANINLMLFPDRWGDVKGFLTSLMVGNVFPRYFHFLASTIAVMGLFFAKYFDRKGFDLQERLPGFTRDEIQRICYSLVLYASVSQVLWGPFVLLTLPPQGLEWNLAYFLVPGVIAAGGAVYLLWQEMRSGRYGIQYWRIVMLLTITVLCMGWTRHTYRANALEEHRMLMQERTQQFEQQLRDSKSKGPVSTDRSR